MDKSAFLNSLIALLGNTTIGEINYPPHRQRGTPQRLRRGRDTRTAGNVSHRR